MRPGLRFGKEREGQHYGQQTLVVLGTVPWSTIRRHVRDRDNGGLDVEHVFFEVGRDEHPWHQVRAFLRRGTPVTVEVEDPGTVPADVAGRVEVMVRVPESWRSVRSLKVNHGQFVVSWAVVKDWRVNGPRHYRGDVQLWP